MIFALAFEFGIAIALIAFLAEYVDSTLGMGYGTTLSPILLILGFKPLQVVPAVLLSELVTGLLAGFAHHAMGNVNFKPETTNPRLISKKLKELGYIESFRQGIPLHLKVAALIASCSIVGSTLAVFLAVNLSTLYLTLYIGILVLIIGLSILITVNKDYGFSWRRITGLALIASFNKGISGGGYGPVVTGGQLLSGVDGRNAIGITSLAEGLTCIVGVIAYVLTKGLIDWVLAPYIVIGAVLSVPLSAYTVRRFSVKKLKILIGIVTIALGVTTLVKVFS